MSGSDYVLMPEVSSMLPGNPPLSTLRDWRLKGYGPRSAKVGRRVVYRRADVEAWVAQQFASGTPAA